MDKLHMIFFTATVFLMVLLSACDSAPKEPPSTSTSPPSSQVQDITPASSPAPEKAQPTSPQSDISKTPASPIPTPTESVPKKVEQSMPVKQPVKSFSVIAKQFEFVPDEISVHKGDHVILNIKSVDVTHGFALPDFGVNVPLTPGSEQVVEFDAKEVGEFEFFCSISCGSGHSGMRGRLIVQE